LRKAKERGPSRITRSKSHGKLHGNLENERVVAEGSAHDWLLLQTDY
jgi:hypothetical protein